MYISCEINSSKFSSVIPINIGCEQCAPNYTFGPAVRNNWVIHYVLSGCGVYTVNGNTYKLSTGEAFLIKPGEVTVYSADEDNPWNYVWIQFFADRQLFDFLPYILHGEGLNNIMEHAYSLIKSGNCTETAAIAEIWKIIAYFLPDGGFNGNINYSALAADIIRKQYGDRLSVDLIAKRLGLDRSYFSNIFKAETGMSPGKFLYAYRMERAYELLRSNLYNVSVVALSVGYGDVFAFSRAFKQYFGVSPSNCNKITSHKNPFCQMPMISKEI